MEKKRIFSGIKPSGDLHLGNYLGAIRQWIALQDEYDAVFSVVDLHAVTVPQDPKDLHAKTLEIAKIYLAAGIDPKKCILFVQSQVSEHAELCWLLNTITKNGDLTKMTQFKDKVGFDDISGLSKQLTPREQKILIAIDEQGSNLQKVADEFGVDVDTIISYQNSALNKLKEVYIHTFNDSGVGFFDYPVLMAADILLYDAAVVPVGEDQVQHVELTRTLARRFNDRFGETFVVPEARVAKEAARIMRLDDPAKKMSKSAASEYGYIALTDDADAIRKKIKKAVTDSGSDIVYSDDPRELDGASAHGAGKPALRNLINIYSLLANKTPQQIVEMYKGRGYSDFKNDLAEVVVSFLVPFQERLAAISDDEVLAILRDGADRARAIAAAKLTEAKERMGFVL